MLPNATQVAQLLDPDDNISCSVCDSPKNRCDDCATLLKQRRKMNAVVKRLYQLRNKRQPDKEKAQGRGTGKKKPLNWKGLEASCSKAKESKPNMGWDSWRDELLRKAKPSQPEQDAILLIQAFNDSLLGWMLLAYPEVDEWVERPSKYMEILLYIMKTSDVAKSRTSRLDMPVQAPHEVAPTTSTTLALQLQQIPHRDTVIATEEICSPSRALEQHMEGFQGDYGHSSSPLPTRPNGMIQPSDSMAACEGRADGRDDVYASTQVASGPVKLNFERPNDEKTPKKKRRRLDSEHSDTHGAQDAIFTSILVPGQELYPFPSPKQHTNFGTPALIEPPYQFHELILNRQDHSDWGLSTAFEYRGHSHHFGTSDCILEYFWAGYSVIELIENGEYLLEDDGIVQYHRMSPASIEKVPFTDLINSIKRSETWKKQPQDCKGSECFVIQLAKWDVSALKVAGLNAPPLPVASIKCIVPKEEAPKKNTVYSWS